MDALPQYPEPPSRFYSDQIYAETEAEISLILGQRGDIKIVQTYNKERNWYDDQPMSIYIVDENRRLVVFVQPLYLP